MVALGVHRTYVQQIDVSVNAPDSGTIKELLVSEEDTVTVGQDLARLELGGAPEAKNDGSSQEQKEPATEKPTAPAEPADEKKSTPKPPSSSEKPAAPEPESNKKPAPGASQPQVPEPAKSSTGGREERRVRLPLKPQAVGIAHEY